MKSSLLHVITPIYNPQRWKSRIKLYEEFKDHMLESGVQLHTIECETGERPYVLNTDPRVHHVGVRARHPLWIKEPLINTMISRLPEDWKYVAWIDADVFFRKSGWAYETVHALQQYNIIQPWAECYDLGPNDEHMELHTSFCKIWHTKKPILQGPKCGGISPYKFAHPGYAWAATRATIEKTGGLLETAILGAADHHMALGLIGRASDSIHGGCSEGYKKPIFQWQSRAVQHINQNIGYLPGTIEHRWHGSKIKRAYVDRWDILVKHKFDPSNDLKMNYHRIPELTGNKPELIHDIDLYFRQRDEDSNTIN